MSEYIVNLEGELGMALAVACAGAGFAREEIVRCRDCYFADEIEGGYWCDRFTCGKEPVTPDGYCKWGERK